MPEFMNVIVILLTIAGWCLLAFAVKDIFITARLALKASGETNKSALFYSSSSGWFLSSILRFVKTPQRRQFSLRNINLIVPVSQYLMWKTMLVVGFGFLYLALDWQDIGDKSKFLLFDEIGSTFWLSLSVFTRIAHYEFAPERIGIHLLANIQFYAGFIFYGFVLIYFLTLRRRAKKVQPFLYRLKSELEKPYSAFNFSDNLMQYGTNELSLILQDWEIWATDLRVNLRSNPTLIFSRLRSENWSWLASANIILDATAAVNAVSDGAINDQAKRTFAAVRRVVIETAEYLNITSRRTDYFSNFYDCRKLPAISEEDILSAEVIYDESEKDFMRQGGEKFSVWQFTYQSHLTSLAEYLEVELPSRKSRNDFEYSFFQN